MLDLTWKVFRQTGNIETYLLMKEIETTHDGDSSSEQDDEFAELSSHFNESAR
ncbi:YqzL family protein [Pontibacillus sp. HMF3514]|uniref:YqzL family protein n=1 Tax=Pontibacillus sp. HMF3514 TaxID=2692425 RepID=UPI00131F56CC|nr:YqzL family protein [Pontibacillus sp. HMF3514]QHE52997.1 YqzL family protein [Pontibacillus sp. HMF3514]